MSKVVAGQRGRCSRRGCPQQNRVKTEDEGCPFPVSQVAASITTPISNRGHQSKKIPSETVVTSTFFGMGCEKKPTECSGTYPQAVFPG